MTTSTELAPAPARAERTACAENARLFQHPLLEDPPAVGQQSAEDKRLTKALAARAEALCTECPLLTRCLYNAVVDYDVAGYVAGTTQRERLQIRARLGWRVPPEDLDTLAGVIGGSRQVNHEEVVRLRKANPHESLEQIAQRLGCSLSTVKRHLRKARTEDGPKLTVVKPTMRQVLDAAADVTRATRQSPRRAA